MPTVPAPTGLATDFYVWSSTRDDPDQVNNAGATTPALMVVLAAIPTVADGVGSPVLLTTPSGFNLGRKVFKIDNCPDVIRLGVSDPKIPDVNAMTAAEVKIYVGNVLHAN